MLKKKPTITPEQVSKIFDVINLPRHICNHLTGEEHPLYHRYIVGAIIMCAGVSFDAFTVHYVFVEYLIKAAGSFIHGIGIIPFVEAIVKSKTNDNNSSKGEQNN